MHHAFGKHMRNIDHVQSLYEHIDDVFSLYDTWTSYGPTAYQKNLNQGLKANQIDRSRRLEMESLMLFFAWLFVLHWWFNIKRSDYFTRSQGVSDVSDFSILLCLLIQLDFFSGFEAPDHSQQHVELPEKSRMQSLSYSYIPRGQQGSVLFKLPSQQSSMMKGSQNHLNSLAQQMHLSQPPSKC